MATDSFTNSDGTALSDHNAAWTAFDAGLAPQGGGAITSNQAGMPTDFDAVGSFYSGSGSDNCQIVKKAGAALGNNRAYVCVRASSTSLGYNIRLGTLSGDNFTTLDLYRHTTFLTAASGLSLSRLSDMTMRVRATANGGNQDVEAWINGSQISWSGGAVYTDSTAPIATGDPGFFLTNSGAKADSYFDDFDDLVAAGGGAITGDGDLTNSTPLAVGSGVRGVQDLGGPVELFGGTPLVAGEGTTTATGPEAITGTGTLAAAVAQATGDGVVGRTASGDLVTSVPTVAGAGDINSTVATGSGELTVEPATLDGAGIIGRVGSGALSTRTPRILALVAVNGVYPGARYLLKRPTKCSTRRPLKKPLRVYHG